MEQFTKKLDLVSGQTKIISSMPLMLDLLRFERDPLYKWASGMMSPIYCDWRKVLARPDDRVIIKNILINGIRRSLPKLDAIVGVSTSGIPWGFAVADALHLPFAWFKQEQKDHGLESKIQGEIPLDCKEIGVVEDLISTGGSLEDTCVGVERSDSRIKKVIGIALFTYEFPDSEDLFRRVNREVWAATGMGRLIFDIQKMDYFDKEEWEFIEDWYQDPWKYTPGGKPVKQP